KFEADLKLQNKKILKTQERRKYLSKKLVELLEKERRAIAESLHNDVGQILAKLNMDLDDVIDASEHAPIKAEALVQIQNSIMKSMDYVSWLAGSLRPHILENLGLIPAIRNMLNKMKKNSNISFHLHIQGNFLQIDDEKALAIYRIAQEALTNCLKHASAENIIVNLTRNNQFLSIIIEDDGPGFEFDKISARQDEKGKLGLIIMHERAIQVGGEFRITSQIGKGTRVTVETPV
ncbi:MAG: sensor histidine kinase, partial [Desulfobacteraceae bacterium]|nr:sensor histidine kinase [Desulfobacteraceae bacterium]